MIQIAIDHGQKPKTLKTFIHNYRLDVENEKDRALYEEIRRERDAAAVPLFDSIGGKGDGQNNPDRELILETACIFGNQWNTAPDETSGNGWRVFNWHENIFKNANIKSGHWLEITPEMRDICEKTFKCGFCGAEYYGLENAGKFCGDCLDSEYLKESDLHLLRLKPVSMVSHFPKREELTEEEAAELMPLYIQRQTTGNGSRNANKLKRERQKIEADYIEATEAAKEEHDGLIWLLDHGIKIDNVIYYKHSQRFCFGWRSPVEPGVKSKLLDLLCEFQFDYDIK